MADASRDVTIRHAMLDDADQRMWLLGHTTRQFAADPLDPDRVGITSVLPQFLGDGDQRDALPAIRAWTAALFGALDAQDHGSPGGSWLAWRFPSGWSSAPSTATSAPAWLPTSPGCSRRPASTWAAARPAGRSGTSPRPSRS